ncbi:IclR family transcriptional regulator [Desulfonema magnum]|uniref:Transcriptional regulator, IclR family n=1 Tax=Desulfonema magnum TaxID=45655 RepID=A0A975BXF2_9BACT|nr:IclR family transcriptional regulator [Desulfonema magnum]QTA93496.1 Transcriptional regulator, IclR family [Desulfonema magnum]
MPKEFKRVPALDKCFQILELFIKQKKPLGISEISKKLKYNKSTVFNMVHTLADLGVLEHGTDNKFHFGTRLYVMGRAAGRASELIRTVHPYLEEISQKTRLSTSLGIRAGLRTVLVDKADTYMVLKVYTEVGASLPVIAGAGGKALLSQLSEAELDDILAQEPLKKFTPFSFTDNEKYKREIRKVRERGIAFDYEEYREGIRALAVPLNVNRENLQVAIWAVGLKGLLEDRFIPQYSELLKKIAKEIEIRFSL